MKNADETMVEADVIINDVKLDFAQSMTLRVALSSFLMSCECSELGKIGKLYAQQCKAIIKIIHENIQAQR